MTQAVNAMLAVGIVGVILVASGMLLLNTQIPIPTPGGAELAKFSSYQEMKDYIKSTLEAQSFGGFEKFGGITIDVATRQIAVPLSAPTAESAGQGASKASDDYSTTNIQVAGVDEPDIVKNDGQYIYAVAGNKIVIIDAYPAESARILSETELKDSIQEMFVNKDRLIVFGYKQPERPEPVPLEGEETIPSQPNVAESLIAPPFPPYYYQSKMFAKVYDISDRENPELVRDLSVDGDYFDSRMIGDYVYVIANSPVQSYREDILVPRVYSESVAISPEFPDVYYFDNPDYSYQFVTIMSFNANGNENPNSDIYMMGYTNSIYASQKNIYVTYQKNLNYFDFFDKIVNEVFIPSLPAEKAQEIQSVMSSSVSQLEKASRIQDIYVEYFNKLGRDEKVSFQKALEERAGPVMEEIYRQMQRTVIHRIEIDNGNIQYQSQGSVPGTVLNQFSMDEHEQHFRIATTTGEFWRSDFKQNNNVYVLDMGLDIVGKLENLAEGERIYSARFLGDKAYLVTFKKVDPLFVIDLSDPANPRVLGQLKIPGYSDYLHPYDENHIIGLGKEAVEAEEGDFAWYQGIKLALFDVSDVNNPKEVSKFVIGHRGTDSEALYEHKAFLFSKDKNLLVIPILLAEIDPEQYEGQVPAHAYGEHKWQGAYVFNLDLENGFVQKGRITHVDEAAKDKYYYFWGPDTVKRSLYIGDVLYTISDKMVKMNSLEDLEEVNSVELPYEQPDYGYGGGVIEPLFIK